MAEVDNDRVKVWHLCDETRHLTECVVKRAIVITWQPRATLAELRDGEFVMELNPLRRHLTPSSDAYLIAWPLAVSYSHSTLFSKTEANLKHQREEEAKRLAKLEK